MNTNSMTIHLHHVGGRDGELGEFPLNRHFSGDIQYHIYDPDESCMPQVAGISQSRGLNFTLHPFIVDEFEGRPEFNLNHCPCTSSLLPPAQFRPDQYSPLSLLGDYLYKDAFRPVQALTAPSVTLDGLSEREGFTVDFLSVDTQGSEARIFRGAHKQLSTGTVGVLCEVELHELYKDQPLFGDINAILCSHGFNFMRLFTREARVNYFRAGIGFRGDGMLMSADALFLRDPEHLEKESTTPYLSLLKLAFIALSFGYVEYALDCLKRAFDRADATEIAQEGAPAYLGFVTEVWRLYRRTPFIPQPSFADLFTVEEARRRFDPDNPHAWSTFDRDRALRTYFSRVDPAVFLRLFPAMLESGDSEFEALLRHHGMDGVADTVKDKRIRHARMTAESLKLGENVDGRFNLKIAEELQRLGLLAS